MFENLNQRIEIKQVGETQKETGGQDDWNDVVEWDDVISQTDVFLFLCVF